MTTEQQHVIDFGYSSHMLTQVSRNWIKDNMRVGKLCKGLLQDYDNAVKYEQQCFESGFNIFIDHS